MEKIVNETSCRSWFCVMNNPESQYGKITPEEIVKRIAEDWMREHPNGFIGVNYEIGGTTGNKHCHMVLGDPAKVRFSNLKKIYPTAHIEPTKGLKKEAEDYIFKRGKFQEKSHTVIVPPLILGEIKANRREGGSVFSEIDEMIRDGMTPNAIMRMGSRYVRYETAIRGAYFLKRSEETPDRRDVTVNYHVGPSGSGKSYTYVKLCEELSSEMVYFATDNKNCFDRYDGEPVIFIDELRYMKYSLLLSVLSELKFQVPCRYKDAYSLWNRVELTSILPPEELYENCVNPYQRQYDSYEQLRRRITNVIFHYIENGEYKTYVIPGNEYKDYKDLRERALGIRNESGFILEEDMKKYEQLEIPFDKN